MLGMFCVSCHDVRVQHKCIIFAGAPTWCPGDVARSAIVPWPVVSGCRPCLPMSSVGGSTKYRLRHLCKHYTKIDCARMSAGHKHWTHAVLKTGGHRLGCMVRKCMRHHGFLVFHCNVLKQ